MLAMIIKKFNTILSKGEQKPCTTDLLFDSYKLDVTNSEMVSKYAKAVPVLSIEDNFLSFTDLTDLTIESYTGDCEPVINGNVIEFNSGTYISSLVLSGTGTSYIFHFTEGEGSTCYDETQTLSCEVGGTLAYIWSKKRILTEIEDKDFLTNIEPVKAKLVESKCVQTNGINNFCNVTVPALGTSFTFKLLAYIDDDSALYSSPINISFLRGTISLEKSSITKYIIWFYPNDAPTRIASASLTIPPNKLLDIRIEFSNGYYEIYCCDILVDSKNIGYSDFNAIKTYSLLRNSVNYFKGKILLIEFVDKFKIDFTYNTNNQCTEIVSGQQYTISGDPVSIENQDILHSEITKGFSKNIYLNNVIKNSTFEDNSIWTTVDNAYIDTVNKVGVLDANISQPSSLQQSLVLKANTYYKVEFDVLEYSGSITYFRPVLVGVSLGDITGTGHKVVYGTSTVAGVFQFLMSGQGKVVIDNVDVREYNTTLYIPPSLTNPTVDCVSGLPLTNPVRINGHNRARTKFDFSENVNYLVETYHPDDVTGYESSQLFYRDIKPAYIDRLLMYPEAITDDCLAKTLRYIGFSLTMLSFEFPQNAINSFFFI